MSFGRGRKEEERIVWEEGNTRRQREGRMKRKRGRALGPEGKVTEVVEEGNGGRGGRGGRGSFGRPVQPSKLTGPV